MYSLYESPYEEDAGDESEGNEEEDKPFPSEEVEGATPDSATHKGKDGKESSCTFIHKDKLQEHV